MFFKAVSGFLLLFGLFLASFGVYFVALGYEAEGWTQVEGRVLSTAILVHHELGSSAQAGRLVRDELRQFYPSITYEWTVDDTTYTSSRYRLGEAHEKYDERSDALAAAKKYIAGSPIPVYYDTDEPKRAVLDPSLSVGVFVPLPLGLLFLASGWLLWRYSPLMEKAMNATPHAASSTTKSHR